jgi:hypothetical protein
MTGETEKLTKASPLNSAFEVFFQSLEGRTSDATHLRLLKAARKRDPAAALERELRKIMEELLHET